MNNYKNPYVKLFLIFSIIFLGCGCSPQKNEPSEEKVTIAFFDAIYNKKDLNSAIALSSASFKKEVQKYKTARNFSRRLLNLSFDSVEIETQKSNTQVIDEHNTKITMTVLFTGKRNDRIYKDVKKILLINEGDAWLVDKLLNK